MKIVPTNIGLSIYDFSEEEKQAIFDTYWKIREKGDFIADLKCVITIYASYATLYQFLVKINTLNNVEII